jgi:hypothetical protein
MYKKSDQINGDIWEDPYVPNFKDNPAAIHKLNPNPKFRKYDWWELKFDDREGDPPWDPEFIDPIDIMFDGFGNNYWRQFYIDKHTLSDIEIAKKYPNQTKEYVFDEEVNELKNIFLYNLENDIIYLDVGGFNPDNQDEEMSGSDLRINHPPQTVKRHVVTLREDIIPTGENTPKNNPYDNDPYIWAWDNDCNDWRYFNIKRIHHMWAMNLRPWYPDQHWIMDKLTRWDAILDYKIDASLPDKPKEVKDPNLVKGVNVTLHPDKIPHPPQLELCENDMRARYEPDNEVVLWNLDTNDWITVKTGQIYHMKILEDKTPPKPEEADNYDPNAPTPDNPKK